MREDVQQSGLRGLAGESFFQRLFTRPIPGGQLHGRIVGQAVGIVLGRVAQRQTVQSLAHEFDQLVANPVWSPWIDELAGQMFGQTQPMIGFAQ